MPGHAVQVADERQVGRNRAHGIVEQCAFHGQDDAFRIAAEQDGGGRFSFERGFRKPGFDLCRLDRHGSRLSAMLLQALAGPFRYLPGQKHLLYQGPYLQAPSVAHEKLHNVARLGKQVQVYIPPSPGLAYAAPARRRLFKEIHIILDAVKESEARFLWLMCSRHGSHDGEKNR